MSEAPGFSVGELVALDGGDGEAVTTWGSRIATLGASRATWWVDEVRHTVALPNVPVSGARWSADGTAILAGTGGIDVERATWSTNRAIGSLVQPGPPGRGSIVIRGTSWSADARHVAVLLGWSGPRPSDGTAPETKVVVLDLAGGSGRVDIPAEDASGVRIVGNQVVVAAPLVRAWTFAGEEVAALPATPGAPLGISGGDAGGPVLLFDADWSIRVVDAATWTVLATWTGSFLDAVAVPGGLIAVDLEGRLHAARLGRDGVQEVGRAETGVLAARLSVTGDGRIVIMGAGPVPVHTISFRLRFPE
jgi:hypothetical protein